MLDTLKRKIFLLLGKSLLTAINNEGKTGFYDSGSRSNPQRVSMNWFGTLTDVERSQEYGLETHPIIGTSKGVYLSPDGVRSNVFCIMVQDDEYRPTDLAEGDVCLYNSSDARVWLEGGKIKITAKTKIELTGPSDVDIVGNLNISGTVNAVGTISSEGDMIADSAATAISALNHPHIGDLGYNTGVPVPAGGGVAPPATPPSWDSGDNAIDMGNQDIKNVLGISTTVGTHLHGGVATGTSNTGGPI